MIIKKAIFIIPLLVTAGIFLTGVEAPFYRDDAMQITNNKALHSADSIGGLVEVASTSMNRYLTVLSYRMAWITGGGEPWPFHLLSLLVHLLNGGLLYLLVRKALPQYHAVAVITASLFLLHPMQVNPVMYASKLSVLLSSFFILLALNVAARAAKEREPLLITFGVTLLGIASKEIAVFLPVLVLLYRWLVVHDMKASLRRQDVVVYVAGFFALLVSVAALNSVADQASFGFHVQAAHEYFLTQMYNGWRYLLLVFLVLLPSHIHPHPNFGLSIAVHGLAFLVSAGIVSYFLVKLSRHRGAMLFFILFFVLLLLPTHSFIPKRTAFAEYQFYLPNAATYLILVFALSQAASYLYQSYSRLGRIPARTFASVFAWLALAGLTYMSYAEVQKWKSPMLLAKAGFDQYPQDATFSCIMAEKAAECGETELASQLTLDYIKREQDNYHYAPEKVMQAKFDFLMKKGENEELYRQLKLLREKYDLKPDTTFYHYLLFAIRANHKRDEYERELKSAREAFPNTKFMEFSEQLPVSELMRRNPEYWERVN